MTADDGTTPDGGPERPAWRRFLPLGLLALAMASAYAAGLHRHLSLDAVVQHREALKQYVEANRTLALLSFAGVYAAAVALSFPGAALLTLLGGFLFGGVLGGIVAVFAATLGALAVFVVARSALGESLQRKAGPKLGRILEGFKTDAASYLLFLRLVPAFPFWLVNLAAAAGGVALPVFAWTTLVGIIPGTFAFSVAGAGFDSVIAAQQAARSACLAAGRGYCGHGLNLRAILTPQLLIAFALLGCMALIPAIWRRISKRGGAGQGGTA
ncbi:hypothetical protein AXW83_25860 [Bosea sp. PAMC 26642]|nr:hypothetical protein AXW83_25860 [Bosea sp. PAMC 26642]